MMNKHILLVDDDTPFRSSVKDILELEGYQVTDVQDGVYALPLINEPFDLVITDILMPETDGNQLAAAIRSQKPDLPIIGMTGGGRSFDPDRVKSICLPKLFTIILSKPFLAEELVEEVQKVIG